MQLLSKKPNQKFILSVGIATYQWTNPNYAGIAALMTDLSLDGVDIDFENDPSYTGVESDSLSCSTDSLLIEIINNLRAFLPTRKLLTTEYFLLEHMEHHRPNVKISTRK